MTTKTIPLKDLPDIAEIDDADELVIRDASETDASKAVAKTTVGGLKAAMGGGSPDRIESPSGAASSEASDSIMGSGNPGVMTTASAHGLRSRSSATIGSSGVPEEYNASAQLWAGDASDAAKSASVSVRYDGSTGKQTISADGAPLTVWEPIEASHAATKGYVDGAAPAKIELAGSRVEVLPNGNIEIWRDGQRRLRIENTNVDPSITLSTTNGSFNTAIRSGGSEAELYAGSGARIGVEVWNSGSVYLYSGGSKYFLAVNGDALPAGVDSVVQAARRAYERRADVEWWDPVWTPVANVDSASNVECQYTRTHRASGGSLVTLEGTITVEIDEDDSTALASAPLPVPATSAEMLLAPAMGVAISRGDRAVCGAVVTDMGSGPVLMIDAGALANATGIPATLTVGFRISYRAS